MTPSRRCRGTFGLEKRFLNEEWRFTQPPSRKDPGESSFLPAACGGRYLRQWTVLEPILIATMLIGLFAINLSTSSRFPLPWQDEEVFTDVAVNLATGHGFVSSVDACGVPPQIL